MESKLDIITPLTRAFPSEHYIENRLIHGLYRLLWIKTQCRPVSYDNVCLLALPQLLIEMHLLEAQEMASILRLSAKSNLYPILKYVLFCLIC